MVYLQNITSSQVLLLPKNVEAEGEMVLRIWSTIDRAGFTLAVTDIPTYRAYYKFAISLPAGIPDGEYEYQLSKDGKDLSLGLLIIGASEAPTQYDKDITYKQYERE